MIMLQREHRNSMNWKHILLAGAATGSLVGFMISLNGFLGIGFSSFEGFLAYVFGSIILSAFSMKEIMARSEYCHPSLKHLLPVAFLTFVIPVFGPAIGAGSTGPDYVGTLIAFGAVGGIFWSLPFAGWSYYKRGKSQNTNEE